MFGQWINATMLKEAITHFSLPSMAENTQDVLSNEQDLSLNITGTKKARTS